MNFETMGLTFAQPWDVLKYKPTPSKKRIQAPRRSKHQQTLTAFETPEERKARWAKERAAKAEKLTKLNAYSISGYNVGKTNSEVAPR